MSRIDNVLTRSIVGLAEQGKYCAECESRKVRVGRCAFMRYPWNGLQCVEFVHDGETVAYIYLDKQGGFSRADVVLFPAAKGANALNHVNRCNAVLALGGMVAQRERRGSRSFIILRGGHCLAHFVPGRDMVRVFFGTWEVSVWDKKGEGR